MQSGLSAGAIAGLLRGVRGNTGQAAAIYVIDENRWEGGEGLAPFCRECIRLPSAAARCRAAYENAAANSYASGEPFYYTCWAGLFFAAVALAPLARCRGCLVASGFAPPGEDLAHAEEALRALDVRRDERERLRRLRGAAAALTPRDLRGIGAYLLEATFSAGINSPTFFRRQSGIYGQQRELAELCRRLKPGDRSSARLLARAQKLMQALPGGDAGLIAKCTGAFLAAVLQACSWDLVRLKAHLRVPLAIATRDAILRGDDWAAASSAEMRLVARLDQSRTVADTCYLFQEIVRELAQPLTREADRPRAVSERAARWLETHYRDDITLVGASRAVGASVPSIVRHLKRDIGKTFHQLRGEIRIAEAKRMLATTALSLSEIAAQCGFCDQSHFTRHLQRAINLTPGQFRRLLKLPPEEIVK